MIREEPPPASSSPHRFQVPFLGLPLRVETNSEAVLAGAERAFGLWRGFSGMPDRGMPVVVRILVEADRSVSGTGPLEYRAPDAEREILIGPGAFGIADSRRREALAYLSPEVVAGPHFDAHVLVGLTLALCTRLDRHPLHAAAVGRDGRAILLTGPSGVGKSTLAYAALRHGLSILAEEMVCVQVVPALRVWGLPGAIYLTEAAAARFPELQDLPATARADGRRKVVVSYSQTHPRQTVFSTDQVVLCCVTRQPGGKAGIRRVGGGALLNELSGIAEPGYDLFAATLPSLLERLSAPGGWLLSLSDEPRDAVPLLEHMLDSSGRVA